MRLCVVSIKECWRDERSGAWMSYGGFPAQMAAIGSLFDDMTLVVLETAPRDGAIPLPPDARVLALRPPAGRDARRKLSVLARLHEYLPAIVRQVSDADAVHVPVPGDIALVGMLAALALRKPLLARYGGSWAATAQTTLTNRATRTLMRRFAGGRNVMLATGDAIEPPARGIDWIFATALTREELASIRPVLDRGVGDPPRLVCAGRLSSEKGAAVLVRALGRMRRNGDRLPLVAMAGDGPERERVESAVAAEGCRDHVRFLGHLSRTGLAQALMQADAAVQPSLSEGFSKAWLDAFAHGLPVVASDVGAARHVIGGRGERGWLVPPGDPDALAAALRSLAQRDLDWHALRRRCREYVDGRTLDVWARRIGELCEARWRAPLASRHLRRA
jgi:hypothetical protein